MQANRLSLTKKYCHIITYGCQMNLYDGDKCMDLMTSHHDMVATNDIKQADVILLVTCSIREKAEEKVFSELGRIRKLKEKKPHLIIGVGGCVASQEGKNILKRAPYVDVIFGPQTLHRLPHMITRRQLEKRPIIDVSFPEIEKFDHLPQAKVSDACAYVSIMEGCSKYCSYCIVPYTRGPELSRPFEDILYEVSILAEQGVKEIHLLGQNVNDYIGAMQDGGSGDLALLIHYIAAIDTIKRIRFTTSHPTAFSQALIEAYKEEPKLVNYLHLPIQHGSDRILSLMKRGYTVADFKEKIRLLRSVRPDILIASDFIVGFPGETEKDFEETIKIIKEIKFDYSYSFIYSPRPGTPAAELDDDIPLSIKKIRLKKIQELLKKQGNKFSEGMINTTQYILITGPSKNPGYVVGRPASNRIVHIKGDLLTDLGTIKKVLVKKSKGQSLTAEAVN
jgi:tRNA-2-methylthio-N6-dimethylallyladenosine synthase